MSHQSYMTGLPGSLHVCDKEIAVDKPFTCNPLFSVTTGKYVAPTLDQSAEMLSLYTPCSSGMQWGSCGVWVLLPEEYTSSTVVLLVYCTAGVLYCWCCWWYPVYSWEQGVWGHEILLHKFLYIFWIFNGCSIYRLLTLATIILAGSQADCVVALCCWWL